MQERYSRSEALPLILDILDGFSETHPRMYQSDFEVFLHESKLEDFYKTEQGIVMVSTIHKAKGREFDSVYMLIDNMQLNSDEERRKLYVGITRAKEHLHIHYNNHLLDAFRTKNVEFSQDSTIYDRPNEIMLQLGFRDIFLDFSKAQSALIIRMQSGQKLAIQGSQLLARTADGFIPVVRFSKAFQEKICKLTSQGYQLVAAKVRFVVAWKKKEDTSESAILLPDLFLKCI